MQRTREDVTGMWCMCLFWQVDQKCGGKEGEGVASDTLALHAADHVGVLFVSCMFAARSSCVLVFVLLLALRQHGRHVVQSV